MAPAFKREAVAMLPPYLMPPAPFPHVIQAPLTTERIAPGVRYGVYDLTTTAGPIVVHVVAIAPQHPSIALDSVMAHDAITSSAETITSMAHRTAAIAGINGDYFDIGATNQPVNVVVHDGTLFRTPRKRYALLIEKNGSARIAESAFTGQMQFGDRTVPITGVNQMEPPHGEISILTPQYGAVKPDPSMTLIQLEPTSGTPPFATYRVVEEADNFSLQPPGYYAAIGPDAIEQTGVPNSGDVLKATGDLAPVPLAQLDAAVGGGPLILRHGRWYDDPDGPRGGSYDMRAPQSGAALAPDGTLFLLQVDGRQPNLSIGVTPREFSALMQAFGATRGLEFDSGGSSQMDVRIPGSRAATLVNSPSDGHERPVADGLFVYLDAPAGPAVRIASQPGIVRAVVGARVRIRLAAVDAAENRATLAAPIRLHVEPASLGRFNDGRFTAARAGRGALVARSGDVVSRIPVTVVSDPARVAILPIDPAVAARGTLQLYAQAFDARGYSLALPRTLDWRTTHGSISSHGTFAARNSDALVSLLVGDHLANARVSVGFRDVPLPFVEGARFLTIPHHGRGWVEPDPSCGACLELRYVLGPHERAAYALHDVPLPDHAVGLTFDLHDDASGAWLKIVLHNAIDEEVLLPAARLRHRGWRHVVVTFPASLAQPARLTAIYAIGAAPGTRYAGSILIKNVKAVVAGSQ